MNKTPQANTEIFKINHAAMRDQSEVHISSIVREWLQGVFSAELSEFNVVDSFEHQIHSIASSIQQKLIDMSHELVVPLERQMSDKSASSSALAAFEDLQEMLAGIKPPNNKVSLKQIFMLLFSLRANAWQMWFDSYQEKKIEIRSTLKKLTQLERKMTGDNQILLAYRSKIEGYQTELQNYVDLVTVLVDKFNEKLTAQSEHTQPLEQLKSALTKRLFELQESNVIARQQLLSTSLFVKQNNALLREIKHTLSKTTAVLDVSAQLAAIKQLDKKHQTSSRLNKALTASTVKKSQQQIDALLVDLNHINKAYLATVDSQEK